MSGAEQPLQAVELSPTGEVRGSVVWLHGLGADGNDFVPLVPELGLDDLGLRFVFPHAPLRPVTVNGGYVMRAWYDIVNPGFLDPEDADGIAASRQAVETLLAREAQRGIPPGRTVLAGFSQGGAIALHTALRHAQSLAGVLALSTYLPLAERLAAEASEANRKVPIFMAHGHFDPVIPLRLGEASRARLVTQGCAVDWHTYPMEHGLHPDEVADIGVWLRAVLG
jgi:phospholipase/carboxylesterase